MGGTQAAWPVNFPPNPSPSKSGIEPKEFQ